MNRMKIRSRLTSLAVILALVALPMTAGAAHAAPTESEGSAAAFLQSPTTWISSVWSWWQSVTSGTDFATFSPADAGNRSETSHVAAAASSTTTEDDDGGTGAVTDPDGRTAGGGGY